MSFTSSAIASTRTTEPSVRSAIKSVAAHLTLWPLAILGLTADLASKHWAFTRLNPDESQTLIPGVVLAQRQLNSGALFGALPGWVSVFIVASVIALAFVLYVFASSHARQRALHIGLALILAGALGNLYDRAFVQVDVVHLTPQPGQTVGYYHGIITSPAGADRW